MTSKLTIMIFMTHAIVQLPTANLGLSLGLPEIRSFGERLQQDIAVLIN